MLEVRRGRRGGRHRPFAIELLETISLLPDADPISFPLVHENAARFQWQMRDFRFWSLQQACANYSINLLPTSPTVAGIPCERVEFVRFAERRERPGHFEADIDPATGFVLAWREFDEFQQPDRRVGLRDVRLRR